MSSFETRLQCLTCEKEGRGGHAQFQAAAHRHNARRKEPGLALVLGDSVICAECGSEICKRTRKEIPRAVAEVVQALVTRAFFRVEGVTEKGINQSQVVLESRAEEGMSCHITWMREGRAACVRESHSPASPGVPISALAQHVIDELSRRGFAIAVADFMNPAGGLRLCSKTIAYADPLNPGAHSDLDCLGLPAEDVTQPVRLVVTLKWKA